MILDKLDIDLETKLNFNSLPPKIHINQFQVECRSKYDRHNSKVSRGEYWRIFSWSRLILKQEIKNTNHVEKNKNVDYIKINNFFLSKDFKKWKLGKIFAKHINVKAIVCRTMKNYLSQ